MRTAFPENVPGDWYVEQDCCIVCAVPLDEAPDLFQWAYPPGSAEPDHCYVARQPNSVDELDRMINAARNAEVECIRYRGIEERIRQRIRERGAAGAIDVPDWMLTPSPPRAPR